MTTEVRPIRRPTSLATPVGPAADDWRQKAACSGEVTDLFFPVGNSGPALVQAEQAKAVCHRCPVRPDCLRWALTTRQDAGVWGGMSEEERRNLLPSRKRRTAPTPRPRPQMQKALANRHLILARLAKGVAKTAIAREIGVSREILDEAAPIILATKGAAA